MAHDSDRPVIQTLYVAQLLDLPPLTAQAAFDGHRSATTAAGRDAVVTTPTVRLRLLGAQAAHPRCDWSPLRQCRGRLSTPRGLVAMAVEVELVPWSDSRCEIGIRPHSRAVPMSDCWRQRRYLDLAVEAGTALAHSLEDRVHDAMAADVGAQVCRCAVVVSASTFGPRPAACGAAT